MNPTDDPRTDDLHAVIDRLRSQRTELTALELDALKRRIRSRAGLPATRRARSADLMKSRLAILSTLVLGVLFSSTGAGLAVTGLTGNDAGVAQYGPATTAAAPSSALPTASHRVLPKTQKAKSGEKKPTTTAQAVQPARQVAVVSDSASLPFTGLAALPILLGGVVLLTTGLLLRRRTRDGSH